MFTPVDLNDFLSCRKSREFDKELNRKITLKSQTIIDDSTLDIIKRMFIPYNNADRITISSLFKIAMQLYELSIKQFTDDAIEAALCNFQYTVQIPVEVFETLNISPIDADTIVHRLICKYENHDNYTKELTLLICLELLTFNKDVMNYPVYIDTFVADVNNHLTILKSFIDFTGPRLYAKSIPSVRFNVLEYTINTDVVDEELICTYDMKDDERGYFFHFQPSDRTRYDKRIITITDGCIINLYTGKLTLSV